MKTKYNMFLTICVVGVIFVGTIPIHTQVDSPEVTINKLIANNQAIEIFPESISVLTGALSPSPLGDINRDGYGDFVVGAPATNNDEGRIYIVLGKAQVKDISLENAGKIITGDETGSYFGSWFSKPGDFNGDGNIDFAVAALDSGWVYLFSADDILGLTSISNASDVAFASFHGEGSANYFGHGLSMIGDINNDGFDDLLLTDEFNNQMGTNAGKVYIILGRESGWFLDMPITNANSTILGRNGNDYFGTDSSYLGDINNDGFDDFAIGSLGENREVSIFFGRDASWGQNLPLTDANVTIELDSASTLTGKWLSGNSDVNGDNIPDLLIGAYTDSNSTLTGGYNDGATYLVFGRESYNWPTTMQKEDLDASFIDYRTEIGYSVTGLQDINGDGYDEIVTNARDGVSTIRDPSVYVVLGRSTNDWELGMNLSLISYLTITSGSEGEKENSFSNPLYDVGDINGDGLHELGISKWRAHNLQGGAYIVYNFVLQSGVSSTTSSDSISTALPSSTSKPAASPGFSFIFPLLVPLFVVYKRKYLKLQK